MQQDFDWLLNIPKEKILKKPHNMELYFEEDDFDGHIIEVGENMKMVVKRFLDSGMSMKETSQRMDVSVSDLETLLNSQSLNG